MTAANSKSVDGREDRLRLLRTDNCELRIHVSKSGNFS